jgi:hypothetical protein
MKKLYTLLALVITLITFAQAPQGFNYQATVRNSAGALIVNQNVNFKFNVMLNSATSLPIFSETHLAPTDDLGQVNLVIGQGTATVGNFSTINWGTGNYYLGIELNTGNGYVAMGTTQLLSVPYALYANSSGNAQTPTPNLASVLAVNNGANNLKITNLAEPTTAQDAATKNYVDNQIANIQTTGLGKTSIVLTGNITNSEAVAKITTELGYNTENIYIQNTSQLTTVTINSTNNFANIKIINNSSLLNVTLNGISIIVDELNVSNNAVLTTISMMQLNYSKDSQIESNPLLTSVSLPQLTTGSFDLYNNNVLISISLPQLTTGSFSSGNSVLTSISLPQFIKGSFSLFNNNFLTSISLPQFTTFKYLSISQNPALTSISLPQLAASSEINNNSIYFSNNAFNSNTINSLLNKFLTVLPASGKSITLNNQNPPAPPTGQGLIDKQTLINSGNFVLTD